MDGKEIIKLKETFKDMLIDVLDDYDPSGIIGGTIHKDTGMGFTKYLNNKTYDFIERLRDKGFKV